MPKQIYHSKIKNCTLIIEAEINYENGTKHFALIKSKTKPKWSNSWPPSFQGIEEKSWAYRRKRLDEFYILWGNTPDLENMGITHLQTPTGKPVKESKSHKMFFEIIKNSEFMTFIHKGKKC
jgi:hypothetical protein